MHRTLSHKQSPELGPSGGPNYHTTGPHPDALRSGWPGCAGTHPAGRGEIRGTWIQDGGTLIMEPFAALGQPVRPLSIANPVGARHPDQPRQMTTRQLSTVTLSMTGPKPDPLVLRISSVVDSALAMKCVCMPT
jgi:hypothetical protein